MPLRLESRDGRGGGAGQGTLRGIGSREEKTTMIRILPPEVADKIAAGEVVERPASVVKELVENSIDAGATRIRVDVQDAGKRLIRVTDNGSGIPHDEVTLAFHRYSTSKIATVEDLARITTLGFRGEALASIAAVAQVSLLTGTGRDQPGVLVRVEGGRVLGVEPRAGRRGTVVTVENLFYNTPARHCFLKSDATEMAHIGRLLGAYALAYPEIGFALYAEGKRRFHTPGSGKLREAIIATWGLEIAKAMRPVELVRAGIRVQGYIGGRRLSRSNRSQLLIFVNRRWVQHTLLARAVEEAYKGLLPSGQHPVVVLNIELDPAAVDVNVHPTKREVRFRRLQDVLETVERAVRSALIQEAPTPAAPTVPGAPPRRRRPSREMVRLALEAQRPLEAPEERAGLPPLRVVGQVRQTYIVAEGPEGVYLIDQHAAHERVLYQE
nr:DNA mismatch repair endonuclease MutL [Anaerolineae bacterium]